MSSHATCLVQLRCLVPMRNLLLSTWVCIIGVCRWWALCRCLHVQHYAVDVVILPPMSTTLQSSVFKDFSRSEFCLLALVLIHSFVCIDDALVRWQRQWLHERMFCGGINALALLLGAACTQVSSLWIWIWIWMGNFISTASLILTQAVS